MTENPPFEMEDGPVMLLWEIRAQNDENLDTKLGIWITYEHIFSFFFVPQI